MGDVLNFEYNVPFSVACWIKTTSTGGVIIMSKDLGSGTYRGWNFRVDGGGTLRFDLNNTVPSNRAYRYADSAVAAAAVNTGKWAHCVATYDGSATAAGIKLYNNGVERTTLTGADTLSATIVDVGSTFVLGETFPGRIALPCVFDKELSAAEVTELYNGGAPIDPKTVSFASSWVGGWNLGNENTHPTVTDRSSSGFDGTATGMTSDDWVGDVPGNPPESEELRSTIFDGANDFVTMGTGVYEFERTDLFSLGAWFKSSASSGFHPIISKRDSTTSQGYNILLDANSNNVRWQLRNGGSNFMQLQADVYVCDGLWHHIVCTNTDGTAANAKVYIDGVLAPTTTLHDALTATIIDVTVPFQLGAFDNVNNADASIAQAVVWDKALSALEVAEAYNGGRVRNDLHDTTQLASASNCVGHWLMGDLEHDTYPTTTDLSPSGNDGTLTNMAADDVVDERAVVDTFKYNEFSVEFDGVNDFVTMGYGVGTLDFDYTDEFSLGVWFKTTSSASSQVIGRRTRVGLDAGYARRA